MMGQLPSAAPSGGYGNYDYSIDGGATWTAGLSNTGLAPGTYDVQIRDADHIACVIDSGSQVIRLSCYAFCYSGQYTTNLQRHR